MHDICASLYKIGNVGHQQELRFPLGILHCHYLPPAVRNAELGSRSYRLTAQRMAKRGHGSTWRLRILLAVCAWKSPFPGARKLTLGSAHCLRRLCSFPASEALLAFGAGSRKSSRQRSFASIGKTRSHVGWSKCSHLSKASGKTRSLTFLLAWLALTTHLKIAVVRKENPAG